MIGVGRVKTPTLAIVCKRELEIRNFVPIAYFEVVATAKVAGGQFQMRHALQERILGARLPRPCQCGSRFRGRAWRARRGQAARATQAARFAVAAELCGSRFGWPASKTLEVAQELYDGQGKKIITYPRAEVRYLPQSLISDVPKIVAGLQVGQSFSAIPVPDPPVIRKGASGTSTTRGWRARAITPSFPTSTRSTNCAEVWPRLSSDEKKLFDVIARAYLAP